MLTEQQIKEQIRRNLINYRKTNGLTGEDVSEALGMNHGTYRSWETGRSTPKLSSIVKLSIIYNITIDKLLCDHLELARREPYNLASPPNLDEGVYGDDYLSQLSNSEKVIVMKIRQLNHEDKTKLMGYLGELLKNNPSENN